MAYLKELELYGFKTFADKVELRFDQGITAIVGPNGSGKSNIVDAVRWVLGEQSAKELRGGRMEDVIFAGSESRRPLGIAEVSLVVDNSDLELGLDYGEIRLTRRVDRDGGSDYLVNRSPWRLKDLRELLFGTGLGRNSYALIGQGEIEKVLLSRPEDRRLLFEEAAAITRYKARQREALRHLGDVRERRSRLELMVEELERRLGPLREESRRAREYGALSERLNEKETRLNASTYVQVLGRIEEQQAIHEGLTGRLNALDAHRSELNGELGDKRRELEQTGRGVEELRRRLKVLEDRRERHRSQLEVTYERVRQHRHEEQRLKEQVGILEERLARWDAEQAERTSEVTAYEREVAATRDGIESGQNRADDMDDTREQLVERKRGLAAEVQKHRESAGQLTRLVEERRDMLERLAARQSAVNERLGDVVQELSEARVRQEALVEELEQAQSRRDTLGAERESLVSAVQELRQSRGKAADRVSELTSARERLSSRLTTLREVEAGYEGYYHGVRSVLRARDRGDLPEADLLGAVSELITVAPEYDEAVEVALGSGLQHIVTTSTEAARRAIDFLKEERQGRATFLPLPDLLVEKPGPLPESIRNNPGVVGWASELVQCSEQCRPAVLYLLGRTLTVRDLETAHEIRSEYGLGVRMVTLDGELLRPGGSVTGGRSTSGRAGPGLLARRRDLALLEERVAALDRQVEEQKRILVKSEEELAATLEAAERIAGKYARVQQQVEDRQLQVREMRTRIVQLEQTRDGLDQESRQLQDRVEALGCELDEHEKRHEAQFRAIEELETELSATEENLDNVEKQLAELRAGLSARHSQLEDRQSQLLRLRKWLQTEAERRRELEEQVAKARSELTRARSGYQEELRRTADLKTGLARLQDELETTRKSYTDQQARRRELADRIVTLEAQLEELNATRESLVATLHHGEVQLARWQVELETAESRLRDTDEEGVDEGQVRFPEPSGLDIVEDEEALEALSREVKSLRRKMARLEPVNPGAVTEYERVHERYERLYGHWNELEQGESALYHLSRRLDELMQGTFLDVFERVREHFRTVFQELFGGGQADLVLTGEGDIWERGIDIVARPPGKKLQQISLLSGGERALTAIALLFAFLRCNPTPFVIMDEIDAALDDSNLDKFARFLAEFGPGNQFVIVTHQKRTMEEAHVLYGVTLNDDGTSRTVSVKLATAEQLVS